MSDVLHIKQLIVSGRHGCEKIEKERDQRFQINLEIVYDMSKAKKSDSVEDAIDWQEVKDITIKVVKENSFDLMERLVEEIGRTILKNEKAQSVKVEIDKIDIWTDGVPGVSVMCTR